MGKKKFAAATLNLEHKTYVVYIASISSNVLPNSLLLNIHSFQRPQISGLIVKEVLTKVPAKYSDFVNIFSLNLASELPEYTGINDYTIKLVDSQQLPYGPIYSLELVELETLKAYIKTNLANGFIRPSKSLTNALILFDKKSDGFFWLYIDYWGLNKLTIKNRYPLLLIRESLDRLERARRFTQLDLTSAYYWMRIRKKKKWKTTFRTWYDYFEYQVISFGLTNAPASF